jgi:hypothetical protein
LGFAIACGDSSATCNFVDAAALGSASPHRSSLVHRRGPTAYTQSDTVAVGGTVT